MITPQTTLDTLVCENEALRNHLEQAEAARDVLERRLNLLQSLQSEIGATTCIGETFRLALRRLCADGGWALGEAWVPDAQGAYLEQQAAWFADDPAIHRFWSATASLRFASGVGLIGRCWRDHQPVWAADLSREPGFDYSEAAAQAGLQAGAAIPVLVGEQVTAVLTFFAQETRDRDEAFLRVVLAIAGQLGEMIQRKRAELALRQSDERLRAALEHMPDGFAILSAVRDEQGQLVDFTFDYLNAAGERDNGFTQAEAAGRRMLELLPWQKRFGLFDIYCEVVQTGVPYLEARRYFSPPGAPPSQLAVDLQVTRLGDGIAITWRDVTQRQKMEDALRASEERYRLAARATHDVIWDWDMSTDLQFWNEALLANFGYALARTPDSYQWWAERLHPDDRDRVIASLELTLNSAMDIWGAEYRFLRADGEYASVIDRGFIVRDRSGAAIRMIGAMRDMTARYRAQEEIHALNAELEQRVIERTAQLTAVNKELEAFSYSVSHDLRAPLRAIDGFSHALAEDYGDALDDEAKFYLQRIRHGTQRMGQLIDDLLKLSRLTRDEMRVEPVDLSALARAICDDLREAEPGRAVEVVIADGLSARGDQRLLRAALGNLLANAWKFTARQPAACIEFGRATQDGNDVYFVRDNGVGFDMAYAGKLFGAFQRLHSQTEFEGTGVGLATVQRVIHRHGGRVWAESEVGHGATFWFTL